MWFSRFFLWFPTNIRTRSSDMTSKRWSAAEKNVTQKIYQWRFFTESSLRYERQIKSVCCIIVTVQESVIKKLCLLYCMSIRFRIGCKSNDERARTWQEKVCIELNTRWISICKMHLTRRTQFLSAQNEWLHFSMCTWQEHCMIDVMERLEIMEVRKEIDAVNAMTS